MSKRAKIWTAALVLTGILVISLASTAIAHGPINADGATQDCLGQGWGGYHGQEAICTETVSDLLGLTAEEIQAQRHEGKSLAEIAAAQGVSEEALVETIMATKAEAVQQKVADGTLTQEQADLMLEQMEERTVEAVNRTNTGPFADRGSCYGYGQPGEGIGPGAMRHWGAQGDPGACYGETGLGTSPGGMHRWGR